jgi:hypothetical protein
MNHQRILGSIAVLLIVSACSGEKPATKKVMTERERDSAIGASRLPGAAGVRGALRAADSAEARNNRLDSIQ